MDAWNWKLCKDTPINGTKIEFHNIDFTICFSQSKNRIFFWLAKIFVTKKHRLLIDVSINWWKTVHQESDLHFDNVSIFTQMCVYVIIWPNNFNPRTASRATRLISSIIISYKLWRKNHSFTRKKNKNLYFAICSKINSLASVPSFGVSGWLKSSGGLGVFGNNGHNEASSPSGMKVDTEGEVFRESGNSTLRYDWFDGIPWLFIFFEGVVHFTLIALSNNNVFREPSRVQVQLKLL